MDETSEINSAGEPAKILQRAVNSHDPTDVSNSMHHNMSDFLIMDWKKKKTKITCPEKANFALWEKREGPEE